MKIGTMTSKNFLLQYYNENKLRIIKQAKNIYLSYYFWKQCKFNSKLWLLISDFHFMTTNCNRWVL